MNATIQRVARLVLEGGRPTRRDLLNCAEASRDHLEDLLYWANRVRTRNFGRGVRLCSIGAGKLGACSEDCKWCAQSAGASPNRTKPEYAACEDLVAAAEEARGRQAASFGIVNSGRRPTRRELDAVVKAAGEIRERNADIQVCASLGELSTEQAGRLAAAGITRYNHNLETSRRMYGRMVTTHTYDDRLATLAAAREAGMSLCCGGIFGLGETWNDRVDVGMTLRDEIRPEVTPLNFLHPIPGTPLADARPLAAREILAIVAIFRLILPQVDIKIAGGREINLRDMQSWMFHAGATSCLIGNYLTTAGRPAQDDLKMIEDLGLTVVKEFRIARTA